MLTKNEIIAIGLISIITGFSLSLAVVAEDYIIKVSYLILTMFLFLQLCFE